LRDDRLGGVLNSFIVLLAKDIFTSVGVVEETGIGGWTVAQLHAEFILEGFTENVSGRMPETFLTFGLIESKELDVGITFERSSSVPLHPAFTDSLGSGLWVNEAFVESGDAAIGVAHFANNNLFSELLGDHSGHVIRAGLESVTLLSVAVGQGNHDFLGG